MEHFRQKVLDYVKKIPRGKVASYGHVAAASGSPRAARQVGGVLRSLNFQESKIIPWWRVINARGIVSIKGNWTATKELQRELLLREGVAVSPGFQVDMLKYVVSSHIS